MGANLKALFVAWLPASRLGREGTNRLVYTSFAACSADNKKAK
jgi:hypothetical protein